MGKRFNPAPGWPLASQGWLPPRGWTPDPSWPPAPPGWQIVIDDGAPRRWYRRARVIGPAALIIGLFLGVGVGGSGKSGQTAAPAGLVGAATVAPTVTTTVTTTASAPPAATVTTTAPAPPAETVTITAKPAAAPSAASTSEAAEKAAGANAVYYANCTQAKAAGAAPMSRGEPGYRSGLDRDDDGVACDK